MAELKEQYKGEMEFYFIEYYTHPQIEQIIEKFNIDRHPETIFLDKDDQLAKQIKGFKPEMEEYIKEVAEAVVKLK